MTTYDEATRRAWLAQSKWLGADAALAAASWLTLSVEQARSVLDDIDPEVLDAINEPNLSGEFADDLTPDLLAQEVGLTREHLTICPEGDELVEAIATAWEEGRDLVWSDAVQAYALRLLGDIPAALRVEQANERTVTELRQRSEHLEAGRSLKAGDTVTVSRGYRLGMWGPVEDFTGTVEEFRKSGTPEVAAVQVDDVADADVVVLFAWDTSGMFAERVYVVARLEDVTS